MLPQHPNQGTLVSRVNGDKSALRHLIVEAINRKGSVCAAASELGVSHTTLNYWRKELGIVVKKAE